MPTPETGHSQSVTSASLVVSQARGRLRAIAVGSLVIAAVAFVAALLATGSGRNGVAALCVFLCADGVLSCIVFSVLHGRAGTPLLIVDDTGLTTGRLPRVQLTWAEIERIRVFEQGSGASVVGIVPRSLDSVAIGIFGDTANAAKYAARLRGFAETKGAPIVVPLHNTSLDAAAATTAIRSIAAGRADVTG